MIQIKNSGSVVMDFKSGPASHASTDCIRLGMEILNLSKIFYTSAKKTKKMEKTRRIRTKIDELVNKNGVTPKCIDNLICKIRQGGVKHIKAQIGTEVINLYPNNNVPKVIAKLVMKNII